MKPKGNIRGIEYLKTFNVENSLQITFEKGKVDKCTVFK